VNSDREERRTPRPRGRPRPLLWLVVSVALIACGFAAWRYYRRTGAVIGLDRRKTRDFLLEEKERLAAVASEAIDRGSDAAREKLAEAAEKIARKLSELEAWLKARKLRPSTREELGRRAMEYERRSAVELPAGPAGGAPPQVPSGGPAPGRREGGSPGEVELAPASREAGADAAEPLRRGREELRLGIERWKAAGEPGSPHEQKELAAARKHFTAAGEFFEQAAARRGGADREIESLQEDCNRFLYDCMKRTRLELKD